MMILAYYVFVGLLSSTSGQTPPVLTISNNYVIKPGNVTITCTVVGNISDTVVISKDGRNIFRCLTPAIPCSNLGNVSAYSTFQNETAGTTTMRINASEISRDAGNWACRYGTTSTSAPVSLAVVTPPPSRRLIEESGYIILELNCTYPNSSLGLTFYLGPARYTEGSLVESSVPCNAPEASLNYTLKFPSQHSGSYNGTFIVSVNNGFYNISINGGTLYTFSNSTSKTSTTTPTTTTVTSTSSPSTSTSSATTTTTTLSSTTTNATIKNTSANSTITGPTATTTVTSTSSSSTYTSSATTTKPSSATTNATISNTSTNPKTVSNATGNGQGGVDINVIVPAVVVPIGGLLLIGAIILVVVLCKRRRRAGKNVREIPDGIAAEDEGNNVDEWKQSLGHGRATDKLDAVYTTPDGFIIYPGPASMSTARLLKEKKPHDVAHQYSRPYTGTYGYQAAHVPSTYTSARPYTHKDRNHDVTDQYNRPSTGTYGYQATYVPSNFTSAKAYSHKGRNHDYVEPIHKQASHRMAERRPACDQTPYYPQTGYYGQIGDDVYYKGGGQYLYGQRSRSHHDHRRRQQQQEYYNQYEMTNYGSSRSVYGQKKQYGQDTAIYY